MNGDNSVFFSTPENVLGIDVFPGPGVDVICKAHQYRGGPFRTVICTSMLEHDPEWAASVANMVRMVEPHGMLLITCAGPGYLPHCTKENPVKLRDGALLALDHYRNISIDDLRPLLTGHFDLSELRYEPANHDTFFFGIKD